MDKKHNFSGH